MDRNHKAKKKLRVSLIVPIFGVENYIAECVTSLMLQTYSNIEYIFVNDCTEDRSIDILHEILLKYPARCKDTKIINHQYNRGLAAARLTGIEAATGDYIYHLDSDDWIESDTISKFIDSAEKNDADMVVADFMLEFSNYSVYSSLNIHENIKVYITQILLRNRKYPWNLWNRLIRRDIQLKALPIEGLNMGEDYVTIPRLLYYTKKINKLNTATYHYRQTNVNSYTKCLNTKAANDLILSTEILSKFFDDQSFKEVIPQMRAKTKVLLLSIGSKAIRLQALQYFEESIVISNLTVIERLIIILGERRQFYLIDFVMRFGLTLKKVIRKLHNLISN